jgi:hypothetical protein
VYIGSISIPSPCLRRYSEKGWDPQVRTSTWSPAPLPWEPEGTEDSWVELIPGGWWWFGQHPVGDRGMAEKQLYGTRLLSYIL